MATMGRVVAIVLLALLAISLIQSVQVSASEYQIESRQGRDGNGSLRSYQCPGRCSTRCSKVGHHHQTCMELCQKCCSKCLCVPPGTFGNKAMCSCYNNWKTREGGPKCP
ncbi:hypothetical protein GIB67_012045 [Kingdonia uniflora]|uniref:Uncharacterized protein n=1 Tax=Kingdonia uniflora TaxID=39325 RepID=A0A7J7M0D5_9MAGN|nr:hypothetical protein GIB67_012045 [Kingdonia uniflora]